MLLRVFFFLILLSGNVIASSTSSALKVNRKSIQCANCGDWKILSEVINDSGVSYAYIANCSPTHSTGNYKKRGIACVMVQPSLPVIGKNIGYEVRVIAGYNYKPGSEVKFSVNVKGKDIVSMLFTTPEKVPGSDPSAWAHDSDQDSTIIKNIKKGNNIKINATSHKLTYSEDKYSAIGFSAAYELMKSHNDSALVK